MNLASPAPRVEPATAADVKHEEPATARRAEPCEPAIATPAPIVEPAGLSPEVLHAIKETRNGSTSTLTVEMLRGDQGADLECYAAVFRGAPPKNILKVLLPCIYDERDFVSYNEVKKYIVIQSETCFVYMEEKDPFPLYAISLDKFVAILEDPDRPDKGSATISPVPGTNRSRDGMVTVLLKYPDTGNQAYQFTFDTKALDKSFPKLFIELVSRSQQQSEKVFTETTEQVETPDQLYGV
ncbi:hypothetical protein FisN_1Lu353 [Fistulifera solaris]|uniref:Uncharacterized protein n=1 Tax=Fistulifera solaris TaxID=1519565 RepID=A0A1Z5K414_FISSO|nr:hypothetical protein FisN_1Lu353 [Fistulifera solaris]|eukprot:GAX20993.1 hypothetical protein FisN_1Lu353 [Fistulifera solaris]